MWGSQIELAEEFEKGMALSHSSVAMRVSCWREMCYHSHPLIRLREEQDVAVEDNDVSECFFWICMLRLKDGGRNHIRPAFIHFSMEIILEWRGCVSGNESMPQVEELPLAG